LIYKAMKCLSFHRHRWARRTTSKVPIGSALIAPRRRRCRASSPMPRCLETRRLCVAFRSSGNPSHAERWATRLQYGAWNGRRLVRELSVCLWGPEFVAVEASTFRENERTACCRSLCAFASSPNVWRRSATAPLATDTRESRSRSSQQQMVQRASRVVRALATRDLSLATALLYARAPTFLAARIGTSARVVLSAYGCAARRKAFCRSRLPRCTTGRPRPSIRAARREWPWPASVRFAL